VAEQLRGSDECAYKYKLTCEYLPRYFVFTQWVAKRGRHSLSCEHYSLLAIDMVMTFRRGGSKSKWSKPPKKPRAAKLERISRRSCSCSANGRPPPKFVFGNMRALEKSLVWCLTALESGDDLYEVQYIEECQRCGGWCRLHSRRAV
jgi:hypothetical protein